MNHSNGEITPPLGVDNGVTYVVIHYEVYLSIFDPLKEQKKKGSFIPKDKAKGIFLELSDSLTS